MKLYVKKLVNLCPDKYDYILIDKAIEKYQDYLLTIAGLEGKTFDNWLKTEI